ncbi:MAG: NADPH:quinone oxidoreductase family protein [Acidimicrobiia bacterium]|nr:NADPH:quinone oxidoreductase family protein [Acidimicrobiia bacterium]MDH5502486.1 NADPH:quinone oxidoreductase family protein [Acidimicrobiia bacterium]
MRAVLCTEHGLPESLTIAEVPDPIPGPGQVVIQVGAAGVNFPDTLIIQNLYQFKPELPFSPGGEVAGTVGGVGDGVEHVAVGDRVIAFPGWGGFAEQVVVEAQTVIPIPDSMPTDVAAAFVMTYGTSYHALKDRADPEPGETLLVLGAAGGVGLAAVELGKAMDLRVIAAASSEDKLAVCVDRGADETINYTTEDLKTRTKALTGGAGADIVYDPVGGNYTEAALRATAWQGRLLVVGFAAGPIPKIPLNLTLLKGCDIRGVFWGSFAARDPMANARNLHDLVAMFEAGTITPYISARYPLEETGAALRSVMDRKATGKIVIEL